MALNPPAEVVRFLQLVGADFPQVNEDHLYELAEFVSAFAELAEAIQQDAADTVNAMGQVYQGSAGNTFSRRYNELMAIQPRIFVFVPNTVQSLRSAAEVIAELKADVIAKLVLMAAQRAVETVEAVAAQIDEAARDLCLLLEEQLKRQVAVMIIDAAVTPLIRVIEEGIEAGAFTVQSSAVGGSTITVAGDSVMMVPDTLRQLASTLLEHADTMSRLGGTLISNISSLTFQ